MFKWKATICSMSINFLDLTISKSPEFEQSGKLNFRTFKKPCFVNKFILFVSFCQDDY